MDYKVIGNGTQVIVIEAGVNALVNDWDLLISNMPKNVKVLLCHSGDYEEGVEETKEKSLVPMAKELYEVLKKLQIDKPVIFIGYAYGGQVVQQFACTYKDMVKAIILLDSTLFSYKRFEEFPHIPLDVIIRDYEVGKDDWIQNGASKEEAMQLEMSWFECQKEIASCSPYGRVIVAKNCGHELHKDGVDLILRTLEQIIEKNPCKDIAYCGINCYQCPVFLATVCVDEEAKKQLAIQYSTEECQLTKDDILCYGCGTRISKYNKMCIACKIKSCAKQMLLNKKEDTCASCKMYPCELIKQYVPKGTANRNLLDEICMCTIENKS